MNLIRKKQIEGLENDILSSKIGSDIFTRNTSFSLGSPGVAEAHLDGDTAGQITTLHINVSDDIGNRYSILNEYVQYDTLIITSESGNISKYLINSIEAAVDANNEGHFILTLQHSFGYNGTFEHSSLNYYFRKSAAVDLIENERVRAITAENSIKNLVYATAQSLEDTRYICEYQFSAGVPLTVPHTLGSNCVMVQIINSSTGVLCTDKCTVSNYQQNSIDIDVPETGTYKVLLITVGNFESSYVPPEPPEELPEEPTTHVMKFDGSNDWIEAPKISPTNGITISAWINTTTTSGTRVLVCEDRFSSTTQRDWAFYLDGSNNLRFYAFNPDGLGDFSVSIAKPATSITDGNWHHICVTWDGTITTDAAKIVFDGTDITEATAQAAGIKNTSPYDLAIGQVQTGSGYKFTGKMSNIQICDKEITLSEIETLYNNGTPSGSIIPQSSNLKAWYKLGSNEVFNGTDWEIENQKYPAGFNSALRFTTTAGITANSPIISNSMTHSTSWWTKNDGYATREDLLLTTSALSGYLMYVNNGGLISFRPTIDTTTNTSSSNGTYKAITNGNTDKWYHYVFIRDGGNVKLYENNIKVWDAAMADGTENVPTELIQGFASKQSYAGSTSNYSNFSFFNTAINESDVQTLYNNGTPLTDVSSITSMNNWYKLDNLALGLEDSIGSNNATATGTVDEINTLVSTNIAVSSGMDESNLIEEEI